ncbi:MAG TPA: c-type cytochrome [Polyangiaceae bacterium]|jgi:mono/diheme cytochrome c family protein|nr:c-type cytochrome [Polyangiaceae bacterium]
MTSQNIRLRVTLAGAFGAALLAASLPGCGSDSKSTGTGTTGSVSAGEAVATKYACTSCHTADFSGDTTAQPNSMAYPANLTPDKDTGIGEWDADTIVKAVLNGIDDDSATLCSPMPKFASEGMSQTDAENVAAYLKSLPAVSKTIPESSCAEKGGS